MDSDEGRNAVKKNKEMTDDEILGAIKSEEQQAYGYINSDLSDDPLKPLTRISPGLWGMR